MPPSSLISLSLPDRPLDRHLLEAPGGFLWWYVDLIDENGDGLVLIWSFGLPFLPGYASRARRGRAQLPAERPSLNLSIYRGGKLDFYLFQEYAADEVSWSPSDDVWEFGQSRIETRVERGRLRLTADLDCVVQGSGERLTGHINLDGVCRKPNGCEIDAPCHHDWTPRVGPASGDAQLTHDEHHWQLSGRGYHDRNGGSLPLHDLGIDHWLWGRVPQPDRELIYYLLWEQGASTPVCKGLSIDAEGRTEVYEDVGVELRGRRKNMGGLEWWETIELSRLDESGVAMPWLTVKNTDVVDSGPFYMRYLTEAHAPCGPRTSGPRTSGPRTSGPRTSGPRTRGVGELVKPERIDLDRHRPLVRMRVHDLAGDNSMWLPLFTGPKTGRVRRLLSSWLAGGRR